VWWFPLSLQFRTRHAPVRAMGGKKPQNRGVSAISIADTPNALHVVCVHTRETVLHSYQRTSIKFPFFVLPVRKSYSALWLLEVSVILLAFFPSLIPSSTSLINAAKSTAWSIHALKEKIPHWADNAKSLTLACMSKWTVPEKSLTLHSTQRLASTPPISAAQG